MRGSANIVFRLPTSIEEGPIGLLVLGRRIGKRVPQPLLSYWTIGHRPGSLLKQEKDFWFCLKGITVPTIRRWAGPDDFIKEVLQISGNR